MGQTVCPLPILLGLLVLLSSGASVRAQSPGRMLEYKVKAAYLFNFTKYVEWPPEAFSGPDDPIRLGILGVDPFGNLLEETIGNRLVGNRKVVVKRSLRRVQDMRDCHLVFICASERERLPSIMSQLKGTFALTVSEIPQFSENGGMITFVIQNDVVRFDVNLDNAEQAGLKISARLLNTALNVTSKRRRNRD